MDRREHRRKDRPIEVIEEVQRGEERQDDAWVADVAEASHVGAHHIRPRPAPLDTRSPDGSGRRSRSRGAAREPTSSSLTFAFASTSTPPFTPAAVPGEAALNAMPKTKNKKDGNAGGAPPEPPEVAPPDDEPTAPTPKRRATAESMATRQREISVSEFFTKNRHLLGFDNPAKALLTTVKEAVDNSLDACEEAGILPDLLVEIRETSAASAKEGVAAVAPAASARFRVIVEDNGPGHREGADPEDLRQAPLRLEVPSPQAVPRPAGHRHQRRGPLRPAHDRQAGASSRARRARAAPRSRSSFASTPSATSPTSSKDDDRRVGRRSTARASRSSSSRPTAAGGRACRSTSSRPSSRTRTWRSPTSRPRASGSEFPRVTSELPREAQEIKPHPHGVELGMLHTMLSDSRGQDRQGGARRRLLAHLARRGRADLPDGEGEPEDAGRRASTATSSSGCTRRSAQVKVMAPPATAVVPIGEALLIEGLKRRFTKADFYVSTTRPPSVYRGNPFVVEVGARVRRATCRSTSRPTSCASPTACRSSTSRRRARSARASTRPTGAATSCSSRRAGLPVAPMAIAVHLASVWVPFTSEAKEAVAHYDELLSEMKLAHPGVRSQARGAPAGARARSSATPSGAASSRSTSPRWRSRSRTSSGVAKDKAEKPFYAALPNFVRFADDDPPARRRRAPAAPASGRRAPRSGRRAAARRRQDAASAAGEGAPPSARGRASAKGGARRRRTEARAKAQRGRAQAVAREQRARRQARRTALADGVSHGRQEDAEEEERRRREHAVEDREARAPDAGRGDQGQEPGARHPHADAVQRVASTRRRRSSSSAIARSRASSSTRRWCESSCRPCSSRANARR